MEKHKAIIYGSKVRKTYYFSTYNDSIRESYELIDRNIVIFEGEIDNPPLEENEKVFIKEVNDTFTISSKARNLDGGYVYYSSHIAETVEDERTSESKKEAEDRLDSWKLKMQQKKDEEDIKTTLSIKIKKWYQFWK